MKPHKLAKYFPILEGDEFDLLVQDIKENGQLEPIVLYNSQILDGVNRYRACKKLKIECKWVDYEGDDPLSYVISLNIRRRHLDVSQRAMLATEMLPEFENQAKQRHGVEGSGTDDPDLVLDSEGWARASGQAAKQFGVSDRAVRRAKRVKEDAPDKVDDIIKGKTSVTAVDDELRNAKKKLAQRNNKREDKRYEDLPQVKWVLDFLRIWTKKFDEFEKALNKFSPEAARFTARKLRAHAEKAIELAKTFEEAGR